MMDSETTGEVTRLLQALGRGEHSACEKLAPLVYEEFRALARQQFRQEDTHHTLQPTAVVHEAFLRIVNQDPAGWKGRSHFLAVGAQAMRRILVDHAKTKKRLKRGGDRVRIELQEDAVLSPDRNEDVLALEEALEKLAGEDPRQAQIVVMRFYGGMTIEEVAETLGLSKRTVESEWTMVRAWLRRELTRGDSV